MLTSRGANAGGCARRSVSAGRGDGSDLGSEERDVGDMGVYIRERVAGPCAVRSDAKEPAALAEEAEGVHREW